MITEEKNGSESNTKAVRVRKHRLSKSRSFVPVMLVALLMMLGYFFIAQLVPMILAAIVSGLMETAREKDAVISPASACIGGIVMLFIFYRWFKPEFQWKPRNTAFAFKVSAPIIIYWFVYYVVLFTAAAGHFTFGFGTMTAASLFSAAMAGICEEMAFREVGISYMKRQLREDKWNIPIVMFTSVVFGVMHLSNAIAFKVPLWARMMQVGGTLLFGVFLGTIFLRTGNIWVCMITHTIYDILPTLFTANFDFNLKVYNWVWMLVGQALLAAWGLYLIRKEKHPDINELWKDKWQLPEDAALSESQI